MSSKRLYTSKGLQKMMPSQIYELQPPNSFLDNFFFLLLGSPLPNQAPQGQISTTMEEERLLRVSEGKRADMEARVGTIMFLI